MQHMQLKNKTAIRFTPEVPGKPATPGVAPLVDIVFLLICFYVFVNHSMQSMDEQTVNLPVIKQSQNQELLPAEIVLNLMPNGNVVVAHEPLSINQVALQLRQARQDALDQGRSLRVVIRADRNQTYGKLDTLMDVCRRSGLDMVILRALERPEGGSP